MNDLQKNIPLIVGGEDTKRFFEFFFNKVYMVSSNYEILSLYQKKNSSILFLDYDKKNSIDIINKIRQKDRYIVIFLLITAAISKEELERLLPLHLSGCMKKPYDFKIFEKLLRDNIFIDLNFSKKGKLKLTSNYIFNMDESILYDNKENKVKLTKQEFQLIKLFLESKNHFLTTEFLEYSIWEEESTKQDCNNRLKYLINSIRKKLPPNSIINSYGLGYKLVFDE